MQVDLKEVRFISETSITVRGSRRRVTVPKEIVDHFRLLNGDKFVWVLLKDGRLILVPKKISEEIDVEPRGY
jgi:bifunctional DNA-binding transcriptional regulator/antitoxin component of YhaV-PrlF toxin-antitoxin module